VSVAVVLAGAVVAIVADGLVGRQLLQPIIVLLCLPCPLWLLCPFCLPCLL